ncbi:MAG: hypothetical protein AAF704_02785 [Cyanobacteria bacterium P01_D01_bin.123]
MSNPRFRRFCDRQLASLRWLMWQLWVWCVDFLNDRVLPADRHIDAEAVAAWCQQFLADRDPGELQYRGVAMTSQPAATPSATTFAYRGLLVAAAQPEADVAIAALPTATAEPFVPEYQRQLRALLIAKGWQDLDAVASTPPLQASYRGRAVSQSGLSA